MKQWFKILTLSDLFSYECLKLELIPDKDLAELLQNDHFSDKDR